MKSDIFKSEFKNCPIVYVSWGGDRNNIDKHRNFKRLLEILEIDVDRLEPINQPTRFEKIILPDESFYCDNYPKELANELQLKRTDNHSRKFTSEFKETIELMRNFALKNRTPSAKKIYYLYGRKGVGEERLADYFKSKGYEIVLPEKLTLDEQLNLLINADSFASTLGSSSHNSIFLRDNVKVILIPRFNAFSGYQKALDQLHPLDINYIDATFSIFNMGHNGFCYVISQQLKRFFGDEWDGYSADDFKTFLEYANIYIKKGRNVNLYEVNSYGAIFTEFMNQLKWREDLIASYNVPFDFKTMRQLFGYQTHVHRKGWSSWLKGNAISNDINQQFDIQAVKINFPGHKVYYAVYFNDAEGWSEEVSNGEIAGTTGKSKPIYGIKIRLDESGAKEFDILYRVHTFDGEWTPWAKNGEVIYSHGQKLNAIQIKLETKT